MAQFPIQIKLNNKLNFKNMEKQTKQEFTFYIDRKVTMWIRETHEVQAESYDNAKEIMQSKIEGENTDDTFVNQEWLDDTITDMSLEDNLWNSVTELYDDKMELICQDGKL